MPNRIMCRSSIAAVAAVAASLIALAAPAISEAQGDTVASACRTTEGNSIPVIERNATGSAPLTLMLTGDGGWANADQKVAEGLVARGSAVVGVNMRSYLGKRRSPDEAARDMACLASAYLAAWHRDHLLVLGYSRGADIAPFVVARWPAELRQRVTMVALVSMSTRANFQFHFIDLVRDVVRTDDLEVAPELQRLRGLNVICVSGEDDHDSGCSVADTTIVKRYSRAGGHRITGGFSAIADLLVPSLMR